MGMLIRVEKDAAMLMMSTSNFDRPDVRAVRLRLWRKLYTGTLSAVDGAMRTISTSRCALRRRTGRA